MKYNLLEEKWIPVLYNTGKTDRVGIRGALSEASRIREIILPSPLDSFAVHRFILTLLYWKADLASGVARARESLLKGEEIPVAVLDGIVKEQECFDLFDERSPFLQDPTVREEKKDKSAGSFFAELATGTNIAHFHHGDDESLCLCLPCAALGLLRLVPWTQSGGAGLTPSVHNAPPIMALATGDSLATTLGLNLVPLEGKAGEAKWSGHFKPTNPAAPIPYLEALTWNPRRILLPAPSAGLCWYCGQRDVPTVGPGIMFLKNEETKGKRKGEKSVPFQWRDPAAFYGADYYKTVKSANESAATDNRDLRFLAKSKSSVVTANGSHRGWLLFVPCTNPLNKKSFDHRVVQVDALGSDAISALVHAAEPHRSPGSLDGWHVPRADHPRGCALFVRAALALLTHGDWATLANAAYEDMQRSPAAFDIFAGVYWGLGDKKIPGLPSRNASWLVLKLMAAVPARLRALKPRANFNPLRTMPKQQISGNKGKIGYPLSLPRGERLEAALRDGLHINTRKKVPEPVDWPGLCHGLDQLLD